MAEYTPNSHRFREEQKNPSEEKKKVEKVVTGVVKTKKKSEISKLRDIFISEDVHNVKSYVLMDVLVPTIKKAIADIVTNGIDMILFGGKGRGTRNYPSGNVSYSKYYDNRGVSSRDRDYDNPRTRGGYNHDDIILETRGEAEDVIDRMGELIETYGYVSVADLYDLVGKTCNYTDNKYGWTNIRNAEPIRTRDGYMIKLPKVLPLDK